MATNSLDQKALARLAIWARLFCGPICRPRKWSGFNSNEWSRLLELSSAVDRKTLLRFLGILILLLLCSSLIGAASGVIANAFFSYAPPLSSTHLASITIGVGIFATISMLLAYDVAVDVAARRSVIETLTVQTGDAELAAKVRRQKFWTVGGSVAAVVLMLFAFSMFRGTLRPFLTSGFGFFNSLLRQG